MISSIQSILTAIAAIMLVCTSLTFGQDIQSVAENAPFELSGSLRLQSGFYGFQGDNPRASRYHYSIYARPVLSIYGMRFPVTIAYYAQEARLSHPFNRFGVSPYYKWAKLHLGHRSMRLSKYTLSGKTFLGAGLELTPGKFRFSALYGKLQNHLARRDTLVIGVQRLPSYDRFVYGGKIGYGSRKNHFDFIVVKTSDHNEVASSEIPTSFLPEASLATGLAWQVRPLRRVTLKGEIAASIFTINQNSESNFLDPNFTDQFESLITLNNSSRLSLAGEARLDVRFRPASFGVQYKRVEPFYRSLGTLFYNSDYQDWRFNSRLNLFRSKLNGTFSLGIRRDNLYETQSSTNQRIISNGTLQFQPGTRFNVRLNFSNFQVNEDPILVDVNEEFRFATLTNQVMLGASYSIDRPTNKWTLSPNLSWQKLEDKSFGINTISGYENVSGRLNVKWMNKEKKLSVQPYVNYLKYFLSDRIQERYGLGINLSKPFFSDKVFLRTGFRFNYNDVNKLRNGHIIHGHLNASVKMWEKQQLQIRLSMLDRKSVLSGNLLEWRSQIGYGLRF